MAPDMAVKFFLILRPIRRPTS